MWISSKDIVVLWKGLRQSYRKEEHLRIRSFANFPLFTTSTEQRHRTYLAYLAQGGPAIHRLAVDSWWGISDYLP